MTSFPKSFEFGWSQSGFQSEMGGKGSLDGNSDWFKWVHDKKNISQGLVSGDFPENGAAYWTNYKDFHSNARKMGLKIARIGIEWPRIFPKPTFDIKISDKITKVDLERLDKLANKRALQHYRNMFEDLKANRIKLIANLYHWSIPLWMHDPIKVRDGRLKQRATGWLNPEIADEFAKYAAYIAWKLDDLIESYSTLNEPDAVTTLGFGSSVFKFPPGRPSEHLRKIAVQNMVTTHKKSYDSIKLFSKKPVGLVYEATTFTNLKKDKRLIRFAEKSFAWDFLDELVKRKKSDRNRLDWIGITYYTRNMIEKDKGGYAKMKGYGFRCRSNSTSTDGRPTSDYGWEIYPEGIYEVLRDFWERYKLPLYVAENGIADSSDRLRPQFLVSHIRQVQKAIKHGVNVKAYMHWSLADNFEWTNGFRYRFGLIKVDYSSKKLIRRKSAEVYRRIAESHELPKT